MEHLALEIFDLSGTGSKYATLPEDTTITITDTSEIFASGDVWSYSFTLNAEANAHIFGTAGDLHGSRLHDQLDRRKARLWVEGLPLYLGYLRLDDEAEVDGDGNVDVRFESGQKTFDELIEGAKANQVPMMDDVLIGMALWRKRKASCSISMQAYAVLGNGTNSDPVDVWMDDSGSTETWLPVSADGEKDYESIQEYPRYVFPKLPAGTFEDLTGHGLSEVDCLNTDNPYTEDANGTPTHPFCHVALCYQKYGYEKKHEDGSVWSDYSSEPEAQRGYEVMPANRVNSAPNFYVIYWIRALMKHLGIYIEENQMMGVEDLRRLFFVNTKCEYKEPKKLRGADADTSYGRYRFSSSFGKIRRLVPEYFGAREEDDGQYSYDRGQCIDPEKSKLTCTDYEVTNKEHVDDFGGIDHIVIKVSDVDRWSDGDREQYERDNGYLHEAYATSDCFPDVDISEVISAIESGFGIRFLFSDNYQRVRIVLLRNLFRSDEIQDVDCEIITPDIKVENSIRGFRMTYGKGAEDTHFYYKGFADKLPHKKEIWQDTSDKHDYSKWKLDAVYSDIINKVSAFDKTCYVTPVNGNSYGIKVDKDAKRYEDLHPSLFEYAGFMDAEDGDCTGEDETIEEVSVGFNPAIMNDLNMEQERAGSYEQRFALFVDDAMRPRRPDLGDLSAPASYNDSDAHYDVYKLYEKYGPSGDTKMTHDDGIVAPGEFAIMSDMFCKAEGKRFKADLFINKFVIPISLCRISFDMEGAVYEGYRLYLQDNYEPNDDGVAPIETHDWGLTLGIMRGSGSDAHVAYGADPDDKEGNDTWELEPGSSIAAHPDTCNNYGDLWPYNDGRQTTVSNSTEAVAAMSELFPAPPRNAEFRKDGAGGGYITHANVTTSIPDDTGKLHNFLIAERYGSYWINYGDKYIPSWIGRSVNEVLAMDAADKRIIIEVDSSQERCDTLLRLCNIARFGTSTPMIIDADGVGSQFGRFSLKLRAERLNPYFDATKPENDTDNRRYLEIDDPNLRGRGLMDQFYKEYSYWVRNARIAKRTVGMTLAQLLAIDKTKRVRVGDITGFIRKTQYQVSNKTGLGMVEMEILYI